MPAKGEGSDPDFFNERMKKPRADTGPALCFSKKLENLCAAVAIYVAYYNFVWQHKTLKGRTPAMAAGLTSRPWSMEELFERVMN